MTALATTTRSRPRELLSEVRALAGRNLEHVRQIPEKLLDVTLQPLMFVVLFVYVFGGSISVPGGDYADYLVAGILVQTLAFGTMGPGLAIATDLKEGIVDRFQSLPISRSAFVLGHFVAEFAAMMLAVAILTVSGLIVGWGIHTSVAEAVAGYAVLGLFGMATVWLGLMIGVSVRSPDAVTGIAFVVLFPLTFLSNAFVSTDALPTVLRHVAEWNPVSAVVAAARDLFGNASVAAGHAPAWPLEHAVPVAIAWSLAIIAIAAPVAIARYRSRTTG